MIMQNEIFDRIKTAMNIKFDKELAEFLELSQAHLANIKQRGTIPYEKIIEKSIGNYNLEYIFFGKGRSTPPKFDLESTEEDEKNIELYLLLKQYSSDKMKDDMKEKLLKAKEFQESL
jgi:transcriptional regulator with XRE-family HTH domain